MPWIKGFRRGRTSWQSGAILCLMLIACLILGGLGWVTSVVLHMESQQRQAAAQTDRSNRLRVALWRLDSLLFPVLARESSRPYHAYSAVHTPPLAFNASGEPLEGGQILQTSPLLHDVLPDWVVLHFQGESQGKMVSPQVLTEPLTESLKNLGIAVPNATEQRKQLFQVLQGKVPFQQVRRELAQRQQSERNWTAAPSVRMHRWWAPEPDVPQQVVAPPQTKQETPIQQQAPPEFSRRYRRGIATQSNNSPFQYADTPEELMRNNFDNGLALLSMPWTEKSNTVTSSVKVGPMLALWLSAEDSASFTKTKGSIQQTRATQAEEVSPLKDLEHQSGRLLILLREVEIEGIALCQGVLLHWNRLEPLLHAEIADLFPEAKFHPVLEPIPPRPEMTMAALPVAMDVGPLKLAVSPGWTPLRWGLLLAWLAAISALIVAFLGGKMLLDLADRRIQFVSAVTHELRTPLTTLRLYLDMLVHDMVGDPKTQREYIQTLHLEAERLSRLISNVLDFSRLENRRPQLEWETLPVEELIQSLQDTWHARCESSQKSLEFHLIESEWSVQTDRRLLLQILGNLIDNACKHAKNAKSPKILIRLEQTASSWIFEVEDDGPGIPARWRRAIFRPFQRGLSWGKPTDPTSGGVGLGLALVDRWTRLLQGTLEIVPPVQHSGACFRLTFPRIDRENKSSN
ncbi:Histidine kinase domain-containing protein [Planctomycetales bacterium 10988]|nr:Histidine kinase domain-containing protein [Planctomycetales bacterium 10988]